MTGKKFFTGIPGLILKFGIVVVLLCGLAGCASSTGVRDSDPVPVVYEEIEYSELESAIQSVDSPGHGFIVEAYFVSTGRPEEGFYTLSDMPNGDISNRKFFAHESDHSERGIRLYRVVEPYQFEIYDRQTYKRIDKTKPYKIYIGVYFLSKADRNSYHATPMLFIDKIEGLLTVEEAAALEARQKAEAEAKKKAEEEAKAAAQEAKFNPNKLDRSQYKKITVEDFSFDMSAGKLPAGSKVAFEATFLMKPAGTKYMFDDVNIGITISSDHNFVRNMNERCFGSIMLYGQRLEQTSVTVYLTVKKPGQYGECSVDIIDWKDILSF